VEIRVDVLEPHHHHFLFVRGLVSPFPDRLSSIRTRRRQRQGKREGTRFDCGSGARDARITWVRLGYVKT
jgi:hypothetical protein